MKYLQVNRHTPQVTTWLVALGIMAIVTAAPSPASAQDTRDLADSAMDLGSFCEAEDLYQRAESEGLLNNRRPIELAHEECRAERRRARRERERRRNEGFVLVEGGDFQMGSAEDESHRDDDERQHLVTLTRDFYLKVHEVTQGEWQSLMGNNPSLFPTCGDGCPVDNVTWYDALAYANALSQEHELNGCYLLSDCTNQPGEGLECESLTFEGLDCEGYRLPTEAEWEYAARAGTTGPRYGDLAEIAWYVENGGGQTHRVGRLQANAWGLHDMLGNVWEWVWDWSGEYPAGSITDPAGPDEGSDHIMRGGGWFPNTGSVRAADRNVGSPSYHHNDLGFRLVRTAP